MQQVLFILFLLKASFAKSPDHAEFLEKARARSMRNATTNPIACQTFLVFEVDVPASDFKMMSVEVMRTASESINPLVNFS